MVVAKAAFKVLIVCFAAHHVMGRIIYLNFRRHYSQLATRGYVGSFILNMYK